MPRAKSRSNTMPTARRTAFTRLFLSTQHDNTAMDKSGKFSNEARKVIVDQLIMPTLKKEREDLIKGEIHLVLPGEDQSKLPENAIRCHITRLAISKSAARTAIAGSRAARSSSTLRWPRSPWRRCLLRKRPDQGRSLGRVHVAATSRKTLLPLVWPKSAKCSSRTPSVTRPAQHLGQHEWPPREGVSDESWSA